MTLEEDIKQMKTGINELKDRDFPKPRSRIGLYLLVGTTLLLTYAIGEDANQFHRIIIPRTEKVQEGYVAPSKLEIECKDLDKADGQGFPVKVDGTPYLLKCGENGKPVLSVYEAKPAEVVPEEY